MNSMEKRIAEDYCGFETAKLLKEKGFPQYKKEDSYVGLKYNKNGELTTAPFAEHYRVITQAKVMKWLRETHNLHISVFVGTDESSDADGKIVEKWSFWTYLIETTYGNIIYDAYAQFDPTEYQSYEEACEDGIKYCLENLI